MARAHLMRSGAALLSALTLLAGAPTQAAAIPEAERLWTVGSRAFQDSLHGLAASTLLRFIDRYPGDARAGEATLLLAKARFAQKTYAPAFEAFSRAAALSPPPGRPDEARFWAAESLFRLKRYDEARAAYERIVTDAAASPFAADALYGLGWANLESGRPEQALLAFGRVVQDHPDHAVAGPAAFYQGRTLVQLKRPREAIPVLRDFKEGHADSRYLPEARYLYGRALLDAGESQDGGAELRAFVQAYPNHELAPEARRLLTGVVLRQGDKAQMGDEYKRLTAASSPTAENLYDAGVLATRLGRAKEAEAAWTRLRSEYPGHPLAARASLDLAHAAFARSQFKEAASLAQTALKGSEGPARADAYLLQGESELKLRRFGVAHQAFQAAAQVPGVEPGVRFRALAGSGFVMEEQKQWTQAARYYDEVIAKSPDRTLQAWARERRAAIGAKLKAGKPGADAEASPRTARP